MTDQLVNNTPAMTQIYDSVFTLGLKPQAGWLYTAIVSFTRKDKPTAFPSISKLAEMTGMSANSVRKYLKQLIKIGLISCEKRKLNNGMNDSNLYTVNNPAYIEHSSEAPEKSGSNSEVLQISKGDGSNPEPEEQPIKNNHKTLAPVAQGDNDSGDKESSTEEIREVKKDERTRPENVREAIGLWVMEWGSCIGDLNAHHWKRLNRKTLKSALTAQKPTMQELYNFRQWYFKQHPDAPYNDPMVVPNNLDNMRRDIRKKSYNMKALPWEEETPQSSTKPDGTVDPVMAAIFSEYGESPDAPGAKSA